MGLEWVEGVGLAAGVLGIIAWIPQIRRIWKERRADGISIPTFAAIIAALCLWMVYGVLIGSFSLVLANGMTLVMVALVLGGAWKVQNSGEVDAVDS